MVSMGRSDQDQAYLHLWVARDGHGGVTTEASCGRHLDWFKSVDVVLKRAICELLDEQK